eukprot:300499-Rhodomonas_salina.5
MLGEWGRVVGGKRTEMRAVGVPVGEYACSTYPASPALLSQRYGTHQGADKALARTKALRASTPP